MVPVGRFYGALVAAAAFALSAVFILASGNLTFAGVSLLPFILAVFVAFRSFSDQPSIDHNEDAI